MPESEECSPGGSTKLRYFFRVLLAVHIRERLLPIPRKFVDKFGKELSDIVVLKGPNSKLWHVTLEKTDGGVSLQNGWQDFVDYYSLQKDYFLIFRYDGNSMFKVVVFDTSACEKEYPFPSDDAQDSDIGKQGWVSKKGSEDTVEILGVSATCGPHWTSPEDIEGKQQQPANRNGMPRVLPLHHSICLSVQPEAIKVENSTCEMKSRKYRNVFIKSESTCYESACKKQKVGSDDVSLPSVDGTRPNCTEGKNKVDEVSSHSESPSSKPITSMHGAPCNCVLLNGYERDGREPSVCDKAIQFNGSDLPKSTENFDLHCFKKTCRFEDISAPRENQRTKPEEYISSSKSDYSLTQAEAIGSYSRKFTENFESHSFNPKRRIEELSARVHNQRIEPNSPSAQEEGICSYSRFFLSKRRQVTTTERDRAFHAANAFKSSSPFFKVLMTLTSVYKGFRMNIPWKFVQSYLSRELKNIALRVSSGKRWLVACTFRGNTLRITKGWSKFVWENNLEEGDVCVFELLKLEGTEMRVHIFRVVEEVVPLLKLGRKKLENNQL